MIGKYIMLGQLLIENHIITKEQLETAANIQKMDGGLIGIILVTEGVINETTLVKYLAIQAEERTKNY